MEDGGTFTKPSGIVTASVELETIPALSPSANTPSKLKGKFLFIKGTEPEGTSERFATLSNPSSLSVSKSGTQATVSWSKITTPNFANNSWLKSYFSTGYGKYATKYYNKRLSYNKSTMGSLGYDIYVKVNGTLKKVGFTTNTSYTFTVPTGTTAVVVKSAYKKFKTNQSSGVTKELQSASVSLSANSVTINSGDTFSIDSSDVSLRVDGSSISSSQYTVSIGTIRDSSGTAVNKSVMQTTPGNYTVSYTVKYNSQTYSSSDYNADMDVTVN